MSERDRGGNCADLRARAAYAGEITQRTGGRPPDRLLDLVGTAAPRIPECGLLEGALAGFSTARDVLVGRIEKGPLATAESVDRISSEDLEAKISAMQGSLDEVNDVLAVARAEEELRSAGFHRNVAVFFDPRLSAEEFRSGVRRSILQGWVDAQAEWGQA